MASPAKRRRMLHGKLKRALWQEVAIEAAPCHYCNRLLRFREITLDHRIPRSKGGRTVIGNLLIACEDCNRDKADMSYEEFQAHKRSERDTDASL